MRVFKKAKKCAIYQPHIPKNPFPIAEVPLSTNGEIIKPEITIFTNCNFEPWSEWLTGCRIVDGCIGSNCNYPKNEKIHVNVRTRSCWCTDYEDKSGLKCLENHGFWVLKIVCFGFGHFALWPSPGKKTNPRSIPPTTTVVPSSKKK